jgi:hypothetical protein
MNENRIKGGPEDPRREMENELISDALLEIFPNLPQERLEGVLTNSRVLAGQHIRERFRYAVRAAVRG